MEEHFLAGHVEGESEFRPGSWYNPLGDCIVSQIANEAEVADRIDDILTILRSAKDKRAIGFQIKGVGALVRKFGWDGLCVNATSSEGELTGITVHALLLAGYEEGPRTTRRRIAYATAMAEANPNTRYDRNELMPA